MRDHQSGAAGDTFLLAYAPSDLDTQRLMNVARKVGYEKAHKYDRFTMVQLQRGQAGAPAVSPGIAQPRMIGSAMPRPAVLRWS